MAESLFSPSWYRVASLTPRLRSHAQVHRHHYRDERWHVLQDHATGAFHRFSPAAYHFVALMDGQRTVAEIWERTVGALGDEAPTQEEAIRLLGQLHFANVLQCDVPPDGVELFRRYEKAKRSKWQQRLRSPLALRFPLIDPERFLSWALPAVRPLFTWVGFAVWVAVVVVGAVLAGMHWTELTENVVDRVFAPGNLLVLWLVFPVVKAIHELGHAFATKVWGGEVHEMGVMLLVFTPVPYVDASAASAFRRKRRRVVVGAAGILVELFLAAVALFVWLEVEPGLVRTTAYNVMLIGGVSSIFFNGNPLLRFDGYYVLADLIEIPNLGQRANRYVGYLFERYLFGARDSQSPVTAPGERGWFVGYGVASFLYRFVIIASILLFVLDKFFLVGAILGLWMAATVVVVPLGKRLKHVFTSPRLRETRARAVTVTALIALVAITLLVALPLPLRTRAEGVVWLPDNVRVRAGTAGFVQRLLAEPGAQVEAGQALVACEDPALSARRQVLELRAEELRARHAALRQQDLVQAEVVREQLEAAEAELARAREREAELVLRSPRAGTFVVPRSRDLPGRHLAQGDEVGYVLDLSSVTARVVVTQADVGLVRQQTRGIEVRLAERLDRVVPAHVRREVPGGSEQLPSSALGSVGGGALPVDPRDQMGARTFQKVFEFDLELPAAAGVVNAGGRVHVLFDHGHEPPLRQAWRRLRQLFLKRFGV